MINQQGKKREGGPHVHLYYYGDIDITDDTFKIVGILLEYGILLLSTE